MSEPSITVQRVAIAALKPDPENVRLHSDRNIAAIKASLEAFGQQKPIVVRADGTVVAGNGTLEAAKQLGWAMIDVVETQLEGSALRAFAIADNRTAELAEWDVAALSEMVSIIGPDMASKAGFTAADVDAMRAAAASSPSSGGPPAEPEMTITPPENPVTRPGDIWVLGQHKIVCGDCRVADTVRSLVGDDKITVSVTSPPYAAQRVYDPSSGFFPIMADDYVAWYADVAARIVENAHPWCVSVINIKEHVEDGERHLYIRDLQTTHVRSWGWAFVDEYAWVHGGTPKKPMRRFKNGWEPVMVFARSVSDYKFRPESVMVESDSSAAEVSAQFRQLPGFHPSQERAQGGGGPNAAKMQGVAGADLRIATDGPSRSWASGAGAIATGDEQGTSVGGTGDFTSSDGMAYPSNVLSVGRNREALGHPAAFGEGLPSFFIKAYSDEGDVIYDPFTGSGTSLVAAHKLNRKFVGCEISARYCDIILLRWLALTGIEPTLDGVPMSEVSAARR